jgi:glycolate oxidase FAD binding subunit
MSTPSDLTDSLRRSVVDALDAHRPLTIVGGGTKTFYGRRAGQAARESVILEVSGHRGIVRYDPAELVLSARAGTPLADIEALLAGHGQMLAFEPPHFGVGATLGGTVACGLSGPRRAFAGSARDGVLGCRIINGRGEILSFGGQVMKNVAGFDVSRLMVGALGTLGVLLEVTIKVLPRPDCERTLVLPMTAAEALPVMNRWCAEPWPLSGLANDGSWTYMRLAGSEQALKAAQAGLGGDPAADGDGFWRRLREQRSRFFRYPAMGRNLWRLSAPSAAPVINLPGQWLYDWGGALRWLRTDIPGEEVFRAAEQARGHATLFRGVAGDGCVFQPLPPVLMALHRSLKRAFDPQGLFNPGRMHAEF